MSKKKLIVNADDFGQSPGINSGIIKAHEQGIVTSASLMVRYPAAAAAADYARNNNKLGIGLHIDLGEWIFLEGDWKPLYEVVSINNIKAVEDEITQQLNYFYKLMGRNPTHIDSHQHVHKREYLRPVFLELAGNLNIPLRHYSEQVMYCGSFYGQLENSSPFHEAIFVNGLKNIISGLAVGITELACHPGLIDDIRTMYRIERGIEVDTLCDPSIRQAIADTHIELCNFKDINI